MSSVSLEAVGPSCLISEGPHWEPQQQTLYYVNILESEVLKYHQPTGNTSTSKIDGGRVTLIVPIEDHPDTHVITIERELAVIEWKSEDAKVIKKLDRVEDNKPENRINDGKCDANGRLWMGTMGAESAPAVLPPHLGSVYYADDNGKCHKSFSPVTLSNGMAWSSDNTKFFFIDSLSYSVDVFDFDLSASEIKNRKVLYDFKAEGDSSVPDGMAIDTDGNLWVACFQGSKIICINPETQQKIREVKFPCTNVTSCNFGGPNLDILYATTSRTGLTQKQLEQQPDAGRLFLVKGLGAKGNPSVPYKLKL